MANIPVELPSLLRPYVNGAATITVEADTLAGALAYLSTEYPTLRGYLFDDGGELRQHVLVFLNDQNVRWLSDRNCPVQEGDRLIVVPSIAGG